MKFNDNYFNELGKSGEVVGLVTDVADKVASTAQSTADVDTGEYRDGIHVEIRSTPHRAYAVVVASDWKSMIIESKTGNLARALRSNTRG